LGKWIIATGVSPLGLDPLGYRLPSVICGTVGVLLLYLLALELWGSAWWAGLAAILLSLDGLHIVQSRIAMLDVFLVTFITAGPLLLHPIRYYPGYPTAVLNARVSRWIVAIGNPAFFGAFLLLLPKLLIDATKRGDWPTRFAVLFYGAMYLPWLVLSRASFLY